MASPNSAMMVVGGCAPKVRVRKGGRSSGVAQKKQPKRGMGVAQLEKLRQQEQLQRNHHLFHLNNQLLPAGFGVDTKQMINNKPTNLPEFNSLLQGFAQFTRPPHIHMGPYEERRVRLSAGAAIPPELPSIPNVDHVFDLNTLSFKKKKLINGLDNPDAYLIPGNDTMYYLQQGVQVLAVHPKERNVVMEYGFFPVTPNSTAYGTTTSTSSPPSSSSSANAAAAASASIPASSIDLSLRL